MGAEGTGPIKMISNLLIVLVNMAGFDPAIRRFESFHPSHKRQSPPTGGLSRLWRGGRITSAVLGVAVGVVSHAVVAVWCAPLLVLTRRGRPRRGEARPRAE